MTVKNGNGNKRKSRFRTLNGEKLGNGNVLDWSKIDPGIEHELRILRQHGIETIESCQGGQGHPFPEPTIRFNGNRAEGFKALGIALQNGLKVTELRRVWSVQDGEPVGPQWEITFYHPNGNGCRAVIRKKSGTATWKWI
jgi:hypothetical protein